MCQAQLAAHKCADGSYRSHIRRLTVPIFDPRLVGSFTSATACATRHAAATLATFWHSPSPKEQQQNEIQHEPATAPVLRRFDLLMIAAIGNACAR